MQVPHDLLSWLAALLLAEFFVNDFMIDRVPVREQVLVTAVACATQFALGKAIYLYRGRYRYGSFEEVRGLVVTTVGTAATLLITHTWWTALDDAVHVFLPGSVLLAASFIALTLMAGTRYTWRLVLERLNRPAQNKAQRLLVWGAGEGGAQVVRSMLRDPHSPYVPVGLLDDDRSKRHLRVLDVPVLGTRHDMPEVAAETNADALLVAIPSADAQLLTQARELAEAAGLPMKILPSVAALLDGHVSVGDIRDLDPLELIGRRAIETNVDEIAGYLLRRRVLVTGAGGSIGSELCRQIHRYGPAELIMLDRDESALHAVELSLRGRALLTEPDIVLADIRDRDRIFAVFEEFQPEVVFHAAALKHLPLLQRHPGEAVQTNIWGTLTVLEAARSVNVGCFVNISTDKAADPVSVLGYSKRIAERLTADVACSASGTFLSVRFGNVVGSRGSVLPLFEAQAAAGGPITVTDPNATRYFMTIEEAVQLVIQAGAIGAPGGVLVLDMGAPTRIADIAEHFVASSRSPLQIVYTGLRPGEKLHEELFGTGEDDRRKVHSLISHVAVPPLAGDDVRAVNPTDKSRDVIDSLRELCVRPSVVAERAALSIPAQDSV